jgi:Glycosyltransferase family 87
VEAIRNRERALSSLIHHLPSLVRIVAFSLAAYVLACRFSERPIAPWLRAVLVATTALVALFTLAVAVASARSIGQWDFVCFWLYGHAAAAGANVYDPRTYHALALPAPVGADFRREVLDVGFPYPPASILLFLPLGYIGSFPLASALWLAAMLAALAAGAAALIRSYWKTLDLDAAVAVVALGIALPAVSENIVYHQTNFLALALLVAAYRWRGGIGGGVAAALAVAVKPYLAVIMLWFALRRRWNALAASVVTLLGLTLASIPALGPDGLRAFFVSNPTTRIPPSVFVEAETASLYSVLLRIAHGGGGSLAGPFHDPVYVAIALAAAATTLWLAATAPERDDDLSLALVVALGLGLYPSTSTMYVVALVPAFVALARVAGPHRGIWLALFALGFFEANRVGGAATFVAFVGLWLIVGFLLLRERRSVRPRLGVT